MMKLGEFQARVTEAVAQRLGFDGADPRVLAKLEESRPNNMAIATLGCLDFCCSHLHPGLEDLRNCKYRQEEIDQRSPEWHAKRLDIIAGQHRALGHDVPLEYEVVSSELRKLAAELLQGELS